MDHVFRRVAAAGFLCLSATILPAFAGDAAPPAAIRPAAAPSAEDQAALKEKVAAAIKAKDSASAISAFEAWAKKYPDDLDTLRDLPLLYQSADDPAGWERSRTMLLEHFASMKARGLRPRVPGFMIEARMIGDNILLVEQCYEQAGKFNVSYRFNVLDANRRLSSFFTVESPDSDNQIARDLGQPTPVFSIDRFLPGRHETVAMMHGEQKYDVIRARVVAYMADPKPQSSSSNANGGLSTERCEFAR